MEGDGCIFLTKFINYGIYMRASVAYMTAVFKPKPEESES